MKLYNKRALVIGGTGFIGSRLVEQLVRTQQMKVRVLVSRYKNLSRIARFDVEWMKGELTDQETLKNAIEGCEYIFYCAYGSRGTVAERRAVDVEVPKMLLELCRERPVERFLYLSSIMVYGNTTPDILEEDSPRKKSRSLYANHKIEAERDITEYHRRYGVPTTIIRPTAVYGPFAPVWTENVIREIQNHRVILVEGGFGTCNHVFIDDLVDAMILACEKENGIGKDFLISGEDPIPWAEFYGKFEELANCHGTVKLSLDEAMEIYVRDRKEGPSVIRGLINHLRTNRELRSAIGRSREFRRMKRSMLGRWAMSVVRKREVKERPASRSEEEVPSGESWEKPIQALNPSNLAWFTNKTVVSTDKAQRLLGYRAKFTFDQGMAVVGEWAKWSNLIGR